MTTSGPGLPLAVLLDHLPQNRNHTSHKLNKLALATILTTSTNSSNQKDRPTVEMSTSTPVLCTSNVGTASISAPDISTVGPASISAPNISTFSINNAFAEFEALEAQNVLAKSSTFIEFEVLASQSQPHMRLSNPLPRTHTDEAPTIKRRARQKTQLFVQERLKEYPNQFPPYAVVKRRGKSKSAQKKPPVRLPPVQRQPAQSIKTTALAKVQLFVSNALKQEFYLHDSFPVYAICKPPVEVGKKRKREIDTARSRKRASVPKAPPRDTNELSERYASMIQRRATFNEFSKVQGTDALFSQALHALRYEIETKQAYTLSASSTGLGRAQSYFQMMLDALCVNQHDGLRRLTRQDMLEIVENAAEIVSERRKNEADGK
jgi:hypothetical protein